AGRPFPGSAAPWSSPQPPPPAAAAASGLRRRGRLLRHFRRRTEGGSRRRAPAYVFASSWVGLRGEAAPAGGGTFRALPIPASVASAPGRLTCRKSGFSAQHQAIRAQVGGQGRRIGRWAPGQAPEAGHRQPGAERLEVFVAAVHARVDL